MASWIADRWSSDGLEEPGEWFVIYYERCILQEGKNSISTIEQVHAPGRAAHLPDSSRSVVFSATDSTRWHPYQRQRTANDVLDSASDAWAQTLRVTVDSDERSDESDTDHPTVLFPDVDTATAVFTDSTLALLRALNVHESANIHEAARLVNRDKKNVYDRLRKLAAHGIAEEGNAKRPVVAYDEVVFDFAVSLDSDRGRRKYLPP